MKYYNISFSPKGTSMIFSNLIFENGEGMDIKLDQVVDIDLVEREINGRIFEEDDVCLFSVPSYYGRVPELALDRMMHFSANKAKAIVLVTYGNRAYDDTIIELCDFLQEKGFIVVSAITAVVQHSIFTEIAKGRPDAKDLDLLKGFARQSFAKIDKGEFNQIQIPGMRPYKQISKEKLKPLVNDKCTICGICAKKCTSGAIPSNAPNTTDFEECISCMRCIDVCPEKARYLDPDMYNEKLNSLSTEFEGRKEPELFI